MNDFTPVRSLLGGALLGVASSLLLWWTGRRAGISGIAGGLFESSRGDKGWRAWFLAGLVAGGLILLAVSPSVFAVASRPLPLVAVAGLLVGFGARWGGGCTSGHGICGLSRLSPRSLVAVVTFIGTGVLTVLVTNRLVGGGP